MNPLLSAAHSGTIGDTFGTELPSGPSAGSWEMEKKNMKTAAVRELFNLGFLPLHSWAWETIGQGGGREMMNFFIIFVFERLTQKLHFSH